MSPEQTKRTTGWVIGLGLTFAAASFLVSVPFGLGAVAGAVVAVANWFAIRAILVRLDSGAPSSSWGMLLALKFLGAIVVSALVLSVLHAHPVGFMVGLLPFVLALVIGNVTGRADPVREF